MMVHKRNMSVYIWLLIEEKWSTIVFEVQVVSAQCKHGVDCVDFIYAYWNRVYIKTS